MRIGILAERGLPETVGLEQAVYAAGHKPHVIHYPDLTVMSGGESGIQVLGDPKASKVDYIIPYNDRHILTGNRILSALIGLDIPSYLQPEKILTARNKLLAQLAFGKTGIRHPASIAVPHDMPADPTTLGDELNSLMRKVEPNYRKKVIVKSLYGTEGDGVWLLNRKSARVQATELINQNEEFMFQQAIPRMPGQKQASDKGILVCGGKVITAFQRTAKKGEFRANLAKGAVGEKYIPQDEETAIALKVSKALSIPTGRLDLMDSEEGPQAIEFNVFPGSQIVDITDVNVFECYVKSALEHYECARATLEADTRLIV